MPPDGPRPAGVVAVFDQVRSQPGVVGRDRSRRGWTAGTALDLSDLPARPSHRPGAGAADLARVLLFSLATAGGYPPAQEGGPIMRRSQSIVALVLIVFITGLVAAGAVAMAQSAGDQPPASSSSSTSSTSSQSSGDPAPAVQSQTTHRESVGISGGALWLAIGGGAVLLVLIILAVTSRRDNVTVVK